MEHQELKTMVGVKAKDIWKAYREVIEELKVNEAVASTIATAQAKKTESAIEAAKKVDSEDIATSLVQIAEGIHEAKATYNDLETAIAAKKQELKEVHDLEAEVNSFVAVVTAKDKLVAERTETAKTILEDAKAEAEKTKTEAQEVAVAIKADSEADKLKFEKEFEEKKKETEKEQERAKADWEYEFKRIGKGRMDSFNDDLKVKSRDMEERELKLREREEEADAKDKEIEVLKGQIDALESNTVSRIAAAVESAKADAKKSAAIEKTMVEKHYEAKLEVAQTANQALTAQLEETRKRLDKAEAQIQNANDRVTQIATGALQAGADAKTISRVAEIAAGSNQKK